MPVMDIRQMRMGVRRPFVFMFMDMIDALLRFRMAMDMVSVIMLVPVFVLDWAMEVSMRMSAKKKKDQGTDEEERGYHLDRPDLIFQQQDWQAHPEKRRRRKEHLSSRRPEPLGRSDVKNDADPITEHADEQGRTGGLPGRNIGARRQSYAEIDRPCHQAFPKRALRGSDPINERREMVVESPEKTGQRDEQAGCDGRLSTPSGEHQGCRDDPAQGDPSGPVEVVMKKPMPEHGREDELEVQPQRNGRGLPDLQAEQERQRTKDASAGNRPDQEPSTSPGDPPWRGEILLLDNPGSDPDRRSQIKEPGELKRSNTTQDQFT